MNIQEFEVEIQPKLVRLLLSTGSENAFFNADWARDWLDRQINEAQAGASMGYFSIGDMSERLRVKILAQLVDIAD